ncbi:MAG: GC-type dockerin domain-anchored protein [Phycisphaerales bacterium]
MIRFHVRARRLAYWAAGGTAFTCVTGGTALGQATIAELEGSAGVIAPRAYGISGDGRTIVGSGSLGFDGRGLTWDSDLVATVLPVLPGDTCATAIGVSAGGSWIAGTSTLDTFTDVTTNAVLWNADGTIRNLGRLPGDQRASATSISADGSIVVGVSGDFPQQNAFVWMADDGMVALEAPPASTNEQAFRVSADGSWIYGTVLIDGTRQIARWARGGAVQVIGGLPGNDLSLARASSEDGSIAFGYTSPDSVLLRWSEQGGIEDLGPLPGSTGRDTLWDTNADGTIAVGYSRVRAEIFHATIWTRTTGVADLNDYLPALGVDLRGWTLRTAEAISDDATVMLGLGVLDGEVRPYVIRNLPPLLPCTADLDGDGEATVFDFLEFQNFFAARDPRANFDGDGDFTFFDFLAFQTAFDAGCP